MEALQVLLFQDVLCVILTDLQRSRSKPTCRVQEQLHRQLNLPPKQLKMDTTTNHSSHSLVITTGISTSQRGNYPHWNRSGQGQEVLLYWMVSRLQHHVVRFCRPQIFKGRVNSSLLPLTCASLFNSHDVQIDIYYFMSFNDVSYFSYPFFYFLATNYFIFVLFFYNSVFTIVVYLWNLTFKKA